MAGSARSRAAASAASATSRSASSRARAPPDAARRPATQLAGSGPVRGGRRSLRSRVAWHSWAISWSTRSGVAPGTTASSWAARSGVRDRAPGRGQGLEDGAGRPHRDAAGGQPGAGGGGLGEVEAAGALERGRVGDQAQVAAELGVGLQPEDQPQQPLHVQPGPGSRRPGQGQVGPVRPAGDPHPREQPERRRPGRHPDLVAEQLALQPGPAGIAGPRPVQRRQQRRAGHGERPPHLRGKLPVPGAQGQVGVHRQHRRPDDQVVHRPVEGRCRGPGAGLRHGRRLREQEQPGPGRLGGRSGAQQGQGDAGGTGEQPGLVDQAAARLHVPVAER